RAVRDPDEPRRTAAPRKRCDLADFTWGQHDRLVPYARKALHDVDRGIVEQTLRMGAVHEQRRGEDRSRGNLMRPRSLPAPLAEHDRRVIGGAGKQPRERQGGVVASPRFSLTMLQTVDAFTRQLVRPRP